MRAPRLILGIVSLILVGFAILAFLALGQRKWGHNRFIKRDQTYYAQVAVACDSLRKAKTVAADGYVTMTGSDESIPKIIRDLNPGKIIITQTGVTILVGQGRPDFGIAWKEDDFLGTNQWTLSIGREGSSKVVYRMAF